MNNNKQDDSEDDLYTTIEPEITYCSSSSNCGVGTILSSRQIRPSKNLDMLFSSISSSSYNNFSIRNTIMLPSITTEESIDTNNNDIKSNSNLINIESNREKEKQQQQVSFVKDKTSYNTLSSRVEYKENEENIQQKDNDNNNLVLPKNLSCRYKITNKYNLKKGNLNCKEYEEKDENKQEQKDEDDYLLRGKSQKMGQNLNKSNNMEKGEKRKKLKPKEGMTFAKLYKRNIFKKLNNKFFTHKTGFEKSRSLKNEKNNKKNQKEKIEFAYKVKTSKICHSFLKEYKKFNQENSEHFHSKKIKKYNKESSSYLDEYDYQDKKDEQNNNYNKIEKKKNEQNNKYKKNKKKITNQNICKKRNSIATRTKNNIGLYNNLEFNKSFHIKPNCLLMEHHKNKKKEKESDSVEKDKNGDKENNPTSIENKANINKTLREKNKKYLRKKTVNNDKEEKINRKRNEKRKTITLEGVTTVRQFKNQIIEKLKQKGKKDKNKDKDKEKEKEKFSYTSNPLVKKEFFSTSKNIQLTEEKDLEKNNSCVLKTLARSNSLMLGVSNLNKEKTSKKIFGNSNNCLREIKIKKKINKKTIDFDNALENNKKKLQFNLFSKDKFTNTEVTNSDYLKYTLNCMDLILDIDIKKQTRLKNKVNLNFKTSKKKNKKKKIALFDLDETLVHCTGDIRVTKEKYQNVIQVTLPGKQTVQVGINVRPYWKQTLNLIKKKYYIVIYTASHHAYADAVLDFMDPKKKYFKYRLYRNNCSLIDVEGAQFYVKDLDIFNEYYDLKDIVIVDNSVLSFAYHLHNGIPIVPYYDEDKDGSLYVVGLYLIHIYGEEDLREANKKSINLDSFLEEAKKRKEEEDDILLEEEDEICDEETQADNKIKKNDENIIKNIENKNDIKSIMNIKNIRNSIKKFSEKKVSFNLKKKLSVSQLTSRIQRKQSYFFDSENDKLKNKSKLFKMYDVAKNDSPKSEHYFDDNATFDSTKNNNKKKIKNDNNIIIEEKNENLEENGFNNGEIDCKSDQAFEQNIPGVNDGKEEPVLVRGLTLREDLIQEYKAKNNNEKNEKNEKNGNNGNNGKNLNKLCFIRSNFYNNFKI